MDSLANKYRPDSFLSVIGQDNIITILKNQILKEQIKPGYLFTGGAGTGKTTVARIFAQAINHGKGSPIEIDAASNNGVENIRDIRENCKFKPIDCDFKVYIIDECHMLSAGAWNGFLKTLEEPPAHCIFILCTTDPQKIPATILSRVQRFDFKRIMPADISTRLRNIVGYENDEADPGGGADLYEVADPVYDYIAKLADGGMRDAISILDTCLGYGEFLSMEKLFDIMGATNYDTFIEILVAIDRSDEATIIDLVEKLHYDGKDLKSFYKNLMEFTLDVVKYEILQDMSFLATPDAYEEQIKNLVRKGTVRGQGYFLNQFKKMNEMYNGLKYETNPKIYVQGALLCLI